MLVVPPTVTTIRKVDHVFEREGRIETENFRAERTAKPGEPGAEGEGDRKDRADIDAEAARYALIIDRGAQAAAEAGLGDRQLQPDASAGRKSG